MRKLIAFDDDTLGKLTQLARDRMGTFQELADEAFADLLRKHGIPVDLKDALRKSAGVSKMVSKAATPKIDKIESRENNIMTPDPDPFEQGARAAREGIPAEAKPYQDGSEQHALWSAGQKVAGAIESNESEGS